LLILVAGCFGQPAAPPATQNPTPVILISIDTLRADHLSAYGYRKLRTPHIDSFAEGGTLFAAINSQIPLTLPSHTSLFTSTYPFANGVEENGERVPAGLVTLAATLRAHGYQTAAFVGSILLHRSLGLDQGFDVYDSPFHLSSESGQNPYALRVRRDGALVLRAARQWLEAHRGQNVFVFLHLFDLHAPYARAASPDALPEAAGYDTELAYVDGLMGRFQQFLNAGGWWDRSLVVLLSDHGESLGEHGETSHGYFIYQSTVWVPLIIHWPHSGQPHPARVDRPGGLIDVAPTLLEVAGIPKPSSFAGRNLLADGPLRPIYSESMYTRDAFRWAPLRSLRLGTSQFIDAPKPELYNLSSDPAERNNIVSMRGAESLQLKSELATLLSRVGPAKAAEVTPHASVLESLGYLGGTSRHTAAGPLPDPKDRLPEYNLFERALAAMYNGRPLVAAGEFGKVVAQDSQNAMARYYLGEAYLRSGRVENAIREWNAAVSRDPEYEPAYESLAEAWLERGDFTRAQTYFLQATTLQPGNAGAQRGAAIASDRLGQDVQAHEHWHKACELDPEFTECRTRMER
jgi:arylsulfatase A-like enzyme